MRNLVLSLVLIVGGCDGSKTNNGSTTGTTGTNGGDGGGLPDLSGDCSLTDSCGGDDGGVQGCGLATCASQNAACGPVGDGCGGTLQCGDCPTGQACGAGGTLFTCAPVPGCTPSGCGAANCGQVGDGCGGLTANCGSCMGNDICGGGGTPSVCGSKMVTTNVDMAVPCGRFCGMFGSCVGTTTTISGTVVAGTDSTKGFGTPDPVYNAVVYIPTGSPQPFASKVSCDQCGADITGDPLILQRTGIDGKFTLSGVPCGTGINLPIVIQLGRWRRQINLQDVQCCQPTTLTTAQTHLPRNQSEGDIPRIAVSTGDVDALECVLRKMGMDQAEFTKSSGTGRVHLYHGNGAVAGTNSPQEDDLVTDVTKLENYDMVLFPCWGGQHNKDLAKQQNLIKFGDEGGRVFATHFSYTWLASVGGVGTEMDGAPTGTPPEPAPWVGTATFNVNEANYDNTGMTGIIDQTFPKGAALAQWLQGIGASMTMGQIPISYIRRDTDAVVPPSQRWLYTQAPDPDVPVVHYTFNTPVGAAADKQCGRVVFSDFHVENVRGADGKTFPNECGSAKPLTAQEKLLEFMLFDLASCVAPDSGPPGCTPQSCTQLGAQCGPQADGCGNIIQCGDCPPGQACGAGGPNKCGNIPCVPRTCQDAGAQCGVIGDGCGSTVDCGPCPAGQNCGGGGIANQCNVVG